MDSSKDEESGRASAFLPPVRAEYLAGYFLRAFLLASSKRSV